MSLALAFAFASLVSLPGCGDDSSSASGSETSEPPEPPELPEEPSEEPPEPPDDPEEPPVAAVPRFEEAACPQPAPAGLVEGQTMRCGELIVLEDRSWAEGPTLALHVMIVRGTDDPKPDPIVHLIGGPGGAIQSYDSVLGADFGLGLSARVERELILFDQRGTGRSKPRLTCAGGILDAACVASLADEGVDLAAYNTEESAADVEDLRLALGYAAVNLYGQSYGTILAQTVMRRFPEGVRSALLESSSAIAHDAFFTNSPQAFELALGRVFAECAADPECSAAFPDPAGDLEAVLTVLADNSASPVPFLEGVQLQLQFAQGVSYLPLLFRAIVMGDQATTATIAGIAGEYGALYEDALRGFNPIMYTTMTCYDYLPLLTADNNLAVNGDAAPPFQAAFGVDAAQAAAACAPLPESRVSAAQLQPLVSEIPTLLLAGTHDSNTPLEIAERMAETLPNAQLVELPGWGHLILALANTCAYDAYAAFLADPGVKPEPACLAGSPTIFPTALP